MRPKRVMATPLILFVMSTIGLKIVLGFYAIFLLLPADRRCPACDGDTIPLTDLRGLSLLSRVCRIQRRWCIGCGRPHLARRSRGLTVRLQQEAKPPIVPHA